MKLHLGCGEQYLEGYTNVDYPSSEHSVMRVKPDISCDIRTLTYGDGTIEEVRNHHFFEHFSRAECLALLIRWRRWLLPHGRIMIETPDFLGCSRAYAFALTEKRRMELGRHMMGSQEASWAYHYEFWDKPKFQYVLEKLGFHRITFRSYANSFAKHYPRVPFANLIGNLIPDFVYKKRGGHTLPNILVTAEKDPTVTPDFHAVVREILASYLVGKEGEAMLSVWMKEFDSYPL
jgi:hypothetical protein